MQSIRVVVIGGGVAGLAAAWFLRRTAAPDLRVEVSLLESAAGTGGKIATDSCDGFLFERGPHGILDDAADTKTLIDELGLAGRVLRARAETKNRYVLWGGRLEPVPTSPGSLLSSPLLSPLERLRALREPFIKKSGAYDESVADFARRRFGPGVVEPLIEPGVAGIFAGDASRLSLRSAFPRLHDMEREDGSILKGFARLARERRERGEPPPSLISFQGGMQALPDALAGALGESVRCGVNVTAIERDGEGYALSLEPGSSPGTQRMHADALVLACGAPESKRLVEKLDPDLASNLGLVRSAPVAVVCLGYDRAQVGHPLDGFGFLCALREKRSILGAIFASSTFEGQAPDGCVQLRAMLGGALRPALAALPDAELVEATRRDLTPLLSIRGEPRAARVYRWPSAIPQYDVGHMSRLAAIDGQLRRHPRLYVCGASYRGVSVNDCIRSGRVAAQSALRWILHGDTAPEM